MGLLDAFKKSTRVAELVYNRYLTLESRNPRPRYTLLLAAGQVVDSDVEALERERFIFLLAIWFVLLREHFGSRADALIGGEFAIGIQLALEKLGVASRDSTSDAVDIATGIHVLVTMSRNSASEMPYSTDEPMLLSETFVRRILGRPVGASRAQWSSMLSDFASAEIATARKEFAELQQTRRFVLG